MIIVRSPLRISLGGGGTDLKSYYSNNEGFLIAAAINKYIYISLNDPFRDKKIIKYSQVEEVDKITDIKHPIFREVIKEMNYNSPVELTSTADIPGGTGLGSSGSFTVALIKALSQKQRQIISKKDLAELACKIEIDILNEPIGKQDQYISSFGGLTCFEYKMDGQVIVSSLNISNENLFFLEENLLMFFTGVTRKASSILKDQDNRSKNHDDDMIDRLNDVKKRGIMSKEALEKGDFEKFGNLMHEHWQEKQNRSRGMSNDKINNWYNLGKENGAIGGKLIGAGGGGFLMFLARDKNKLRSVMVKEGLIEVDFKFDFQGTKVLIDK